MNRLDEILEARDFLKSKYDERPQVGIVLGSGLEEVAARIEEPRAVPYHEVPHWPASAVPGHRGESIDGKLGGRRVVVLSGRVHLYEGFSASEVVFGIRVLGCFGVRFVVLTNAAGILNEDWRPGELALLSDHINLQGVNPLTGPNDDRLGPRFPDLSETYSARSREWIREAAREQGVVLREGVYAGVPGPNYETPAEVCHLRSIGADMVGMSTVQETLAARHMGMEVLGLSVLTNFAAGLSKQPLSHEEVLAAGKEAAPRVALVLEALMSKWSEPSSR